MIFEIDEKKNFTEIMEKQGVFSKEAIDIIYQYLKNFEFLPDSDGYSNEFYIKNNGDIFLGNKKWIFKELTKYQLKTEAEAVFISFENQTIEEYIQFLKKHKSIIGETETGTLIIKVA